MSRRRGSCRPRYVSFLLEMIFIGEKEADEGMVGVYSEGDEG